MRPSNQLIEEIRNKFTKSVTTDAKFTIQTISNLIESNARVENAIDKLHESINKANNQSGRLQKRIYALTTVIVIFALVQVIAVLVELF